MNLLAASYPLIEKIKTNIVNPIIGLMFALAVVYFLWGVFQLVTKNDDTTRAEEGRMHILWGLVGMFIMFSVFGIMNLICNTINC
jgi:hypothetical protein